MSDNKLEIEIAIKNAAAAHAELKKVEDALKAQDSSVKLTGRDLEKYNAIMGESAAGVKKATPEVEKLTGSKEKLKATLKGLSHEIPGLNYGLALLKNGYTGAALGIAALASAAISYIRSTYDMMRAESDLNEEFRQSELRRRINRDLTREEIADAPKVIDALQAILDKRKEDAEWADKKKKAQQDAAETGIDARVASGAITPAQAIAEKHKLAEKARDEDRAALLAGMEEELKLAEEHARKLASVDLKAADAAVAAAKEELKKREDLVAQGPGKDIEKMTAENNANRAELAVWDSLSPAEKAMRVAGGLAVGRDIAGEMEQRRQNIAGNDGKLGAMIASQKNREEDLKDAQRGVTSATAAQSAAAGLVTAARDRAAGLRTSLGRERGEGQGIYDLERQTARQKTRLELDRAFQDAPELSLEEIEASDTLAAFDLSNRPHPPKPGGDRGFIPQARRRVNRANASIAAAQAGLSAASSPQGVQAWQAQLAAAESAAARATAALNALTESVAANANAQSTALNRATAIINIQR